MTNPQEWHQNLMSQEMPSGLSVELWLNKATAPLPSSLSLRGKTESFTSSSAQALDELLTDFKFSTNLHPESSPPFDELRERRRQYRTHL